MRVIRLAIAEQKAMTGAYPISHEIGVEQLSWLKIAPESRRDAWGRPLLYMSSGDSYVIWSNGRDGRMDKDRSEGASMDNDTDIVIYNGRWWKWIVGAPGDRSPAETDPFEEIREALAR